MKQPRLLDAPLKEGFVEGKIHYWVTPPDILDIWQEEFEFDYDPCPHPRPKGYDGLEAEWGQMNYVNPPFTGGVTRWFRKAEEEMKKGKTTILILPFYQSRVISMALESGAELRYIGQIRFLALENGEPNPGKARDIVCTLCNDDNET